MRYDTDEYSKKSQDSALLDDIYRVGQEALQDKDEFCSIIAEVIFDSGLEQKLQDALYIIVHASTNQSKLEACGDISQIFDEAAEIFSQRLVRKNNPGRLLGVA